MFVHSMVFYTNVCSFNGFYTSVCSLYIYIYIYVYLTMYNKNKIVKCILN